MRYSETKGIRIVGISTAVPDRWSATDTYKDLIGAKTIESFKKSSGVLGRYIALPSQTAGDLCFSAAKKLIEAKQVDPKEIGALILVTQTPDYGDPSTACVLQHRLGLSESCYSFDVNLGCSGYSYGLNIVASMMACSDISYALLLAGDTKACEPIANDGNHSASLLLGDAGTATLIQKTNQINDILRFTGSTFGEGFRTVRNFYGGYRHPAPIQPETMDDLEVFRFVLEQVPIAIRDFLSHYDTSLEQFDYIVFHQASKFALTQVAKKLKIDLSKFPLSIENYGNTTSATIPVTLCSALGKEFQRDGGTHHTESFKVLACGFGVGLSVSAASFTIRNADILPVIKTKEIFIDGIGT